MVICCDRGFYSDLLLSHSQASHYRNTGYQAFLYTDTDTGYQAIPYTDTDTGYQASHHRDTCYEASHHTYTGYEALPLQIFNIGYQASHYTGTGYQKSDHTVMISGFVIRNFFLKCLVLLRQNLDS